MKNIQLSAFLLLLFCCTCTLHAQDGKLKKANQLFLEFSYPEAAEEYKKALAKAPDLAEAKIKLAECYHYMNMPVEAEYWFEQAIDLPESEPIHKYWYGLALKMAGKFEEAKQMFIEYAQLVPADTRGLRQVEATEQSNYFLTDPGIYQVSIASNVNSSFADFGPAFYENGIMYASERGMAGKGNKGKIYNWTEAPFLDLFYAEASGDNPCNLGQAESMKGKVNTEYHEGTLSFSPDFGTVYFTRDNFTKGKLGFEEEDNICTVNLQIYEAKIQGDKWADVKPLPFNDKDYSVGHPTLSPDGQALYFVSDMPGGYGETDLYVSYKSGDSWGAPENLGPEINTEGREMFPFMSADGILYFSSDALPGLGGLDVFSSQLLDDGTWSAPENLRYPINTNNDDFSFIIDESNEKGYFSSNRPGGNGDDDIYCFTKLSNIMRVEVVDCETQEPIEDALVKLLEGPNIMQKKKTSANGVVTFPLAQGKEYNVVASKLGYEEGAQPAFVDVPGTVEVKIPICPEPPPSTCTDGVMNGEEEGIDCGGPDCPPCVPEATCDDGEMNGEEEGIDCGGPDCPPCEPEATCNDGIMNQDETGIDCGGVCPVCFTCEDGIQNGLEEGVDCGGPDCPACPDNYVDNPNSEPPPPPQPTCDDGVRNGQELGVDCGGPDCPPCPMPEATCYDGIMNQDETGVDCGGVCQPCVQAATCYDGKMNGMETGVDCGGPDCPPCRVIAPALPDVCEVRGMIFEKQNGQPVSGAIVKLTVLATGEERTFVTGSDGVYSFELYPEEDFVLYATKEGYFTESKSITTRGRDCTAPNQRDLALDVAVGRMSTGPIPQQPTAPGNYVPLPEPITIIDNEKPNPLLPSWFRLNHIYYDFDKHNIRDDARPELDKIVRLMFENPSIVVELGSHTDSRGTDKYNQDLSQRRAEAAVAYIAERGIDRNRMTAQGYGESQLFNECADGVKCNERKHQENRRTEFKIVGYYTGPQYSLPRYFGPDAHRRGRNYYYGVSGEGDFISDPNQSAGSYGVNNTSYTNPSSYTGGPTHNSSYSGTGGGSSNYGVSSGTHTNPSGGSTYNGGSSYSGGSHSGGSHSGGGSSSYDSGSSYSGSGGGSSSYDSGSSYSGSGGGSSSYDSGSSYSGSGGGSSSYDSGSSYSGSGGGSSSYDSGSSYSGSGGGSSSYDSGSSYSGSGGGSSSYDSGSSYSGSGGGSSSYDSGSSYSGSGGGSSSYDSGSSYSSGGSGYSSGSGTHSGSGSSGGGTFYDQQYSTGGNYQYGGSSGTTGGGSTGTQYNTNTGSYSSGSGSQSGGTGMGNKNGCCIEPMTGGDYRKNPAVGTQFKVQIGSYATPNMSEFDRVNDLGFVSTETANNGMERVVIGPFSDKKSAEDALMQIRYRGFGKAYLVKYKNGLRVGR